MEIELTRQQEADQAGFKRFASDEIAPYAGEADLEERFPSAVLRKIAQSGYLGSILSREWGGNELETFLGRRADMLTRSVMKMLPLRSRVDVPTSCIRPAVRTTGDPQSIAERLL
jgi:alkylation response protein AidB-like acyl-CoA dehydrogenase